MDHEEAVSAIQSTYHAYWTAICTYFQLFYSVEIPYQAPSTNQFPYSAKFEIPREYNPFFTHILLTITQDKGETLEFVVSNGASEYKETIHPEDGIIMHQIFTWLKKHASQNPKFTKFLNAMKKYLQEHQLPTVESVSVEQYIDGCFYVITPPPGFSHTTTHIHLTIYNDDTKPAKISCENTGGFNKNTTFISLEAPDVEVESKVIEWLGQNRGLNTTFIETIFMKYLGIMNDWFKSNNLIETQYDSVILEDNKQDGQDYVFIPPDHYNPNIRSITLSFNIDNEYDQNGEIPRIYGEDIMCTFKTGHDRDSEAEISSPVSEYIDEIHNLMWRKTDTIPEIPAHNKKAIEDWLTKYHLPPPKESRLPRPADNLLRLDTKLTQLLSRFGQPP